MTMWRRVAHLFARARVSAALPVCGASARPPVARVGRRRARERRERVALVRLVELGGVEQTIDLRTVSEP